MKSLLSHGIQLEEMGGDIQVVKVSALMVSFSNYMFM